MDVSGPFSYRELPRRESWFAATSLFYQDSELLDGICPSKRLGWEFEGLYPYTVATGLDAAANEVHVGHVEGWLANWSSPLVVRDRGRGSVTALTFPVGNAYGDNPVATHLKSEAGSSQFGGVERHRLFGCSQLRPVRAHTPAIKGLGRGGRRLSARARRW